MHSLNFSLSWVVTKKLNVLHCNFFPRVFVEVLQLIFNLHLPR